jgi:hypothetical protein
VEIKEGRSMKFSSFSVSIGDGVYLDFGWRDMGEGWTLSDKENGVQWFYNGPMQERHVPALLKKFGLDEVFKKEPTPPFEVLCNLPPAGLIALRRKWEQQHGVPPRMVISDLNITMNIRAEEVGGLQVAA